MTAPDQYLAQFGRSGGLGCFALDAPLPTLRRGQRVVLKTFRGTEAGTILCPANLRQARMVAPSSSGVLLRTFSADDAMRFQALQERSSEIHRETRALLTRERIPVEIIDLEILLDGDKAILQALAPTSYAGFDDLTTRLQECFALSFFVENLAEPIADPITKSHGCDKPDCGKTEGGGGCDTCSTGGGCSSCSSGSNVDLREYFSHLRGQMETKSRVPLL